MMVVARSPGAAAQTVPDSGQAWAVAYSVSGCGQAGYQLPGLAGALAAKGAGTVVGKLRMLTRRAGGVGRGPQAWPSDDEELQGRDHVAPSRYRPAEIEQDMRAEPGVVYRLDVTPAESSRLRRRPVRPGGLAA